MIDQPSQEPENNEDKPSLLDKAKEIVKKLPAISISFTHQCDDCKKSARGLWITYRF